MYQRNEHRGPSDVIFFKHILVSNENLATVKLQALKERIFFFVDNDRWQKKKIKRSDEIRTKTTDSRLCMMS